LSRFTRMHHQTILVVHGGGKDGEAMLLLSVC